MYDFDEIVPREGTCSIKYGDLKKINENASDDAIPMWIADMDFRCAPEILIALHQRVNAGIFGYSSADERYYCALEKWYRTRYGIEIKREDVVITNGVVSAINHLVKILTSPGDGIIIMTPSYGPFDRAAKGAEGRIPLYSRMIYDRGRFETDWADFEAKAKEPSTKLFILCNPHNPTGRVWDRQELERFHAICRENSVTIISDEIHSDITRTGTDTVSMLDVASDDPSVAVCTAPSKTFNMAGNSMSNIILRDPEVRDALRRACSASQSPFSLAATTAAYEHGAAWVDAMRAYLDSNFEYLRAFLDREFPQCGYVIPGATYLAWVDMRFTGLDNSSLEDVLAKAGVLIEAGGSFVDNADGFVRINIACPKSVLAEACERIKKAFKG
ncbi:MAG: PatB family C-S lyase [Eubacteriales bacterium]|nr:PatB family C-S lyase [Eubacteriales bacterium]